MGFGQIFKHVGTINGNDDLEALIDDVGAARNRYVGLVCRLSSRQANYKPAPDRWSALEITEHLFWAEQHSLWSMWQAWQGYRNRKPIWTGELTNQGLVIEQIIDRTWQAREQAPAYTVPRMGGTLEFWYASLLGLQLPLLTLGRQVRHENLEAIIHPHPVSGPLDMWQQIDFLRFHIDRHWRQVGALFPHLEATRR